MILFFGTIKKYKIKKPDMFPVSAKNSINMNSSFHLVKYAKIRYKILYDYDFLCQF